MLYTYTHAFNIFTGPLLLHHLDLAHMKTQTFFILHFNLQSIIIYRYVHIVLRIKAEVQDIGEK